MSVVARLPRRWVWLRLLGVALFVGPFALTAPFMTGDAAGTPPLWQWGLLEVSAKGVSLAIVLSCKAFTLALLAMLLLATAPLDATLKAAHALQVPGLLVQLTLLSYRYAVHLAGELKRLRIALRLRGFQQRTDAHSVRTMGRVMGTMLVRAHERGERVAQAMICRGFDGQYRSLTPFQTRWFDVMFFLGLLLGAATLVLWDLGIV